MPQGVEESLKLFTGEKDNYNTKGVSYEHTVYEVYLYVLIFSEFSDNQPVARTNKMLHFLQKLLSYPQLKYLINESNCFYNDPLHVAAHHGHLDIVQVCVLS